MEGLVWDGLFVPLIPTGRYPQLCETAVKGEWEEAPFKRFKKEVKILKKLNLSSKRFVVPSERNVYVRKDFT
ncbi:hypothetical protein [Lachnotalea glycerini]|uniref:hypothetical protein n=1 Tax=Lachnotalea glycerini TaxID=1763509 RepID=UPI0011B5757B|nr:hypothetical protein [Lachnotalea glycerini]